MINSAITRRSFGSVLGCGMVVSTFAQGAEERKVDPTFLCRHVPSIVPKPCEYTSESCHYRPVFGAGDPEVSIIRSLGRYGELAVEPHGASSTVRFQGEELVYVVLDGEGEVQYGGTPSMIRKNDFFYVPPGLAHSLKAPGAGALRAIAMGFRIPRGESPAPPSRLMLANIDDVPKQVVGNHPPSTLYQLMMGTTESTRDKLASSHVLTSLFIMEFASGGTNFPHHHEEEEEAYLLLDGYGDMVAGGGMNGVEGLHPAKPGDAYFFRLNCTVGFYSRGKPDEPKAHILAARSRFPFRRRQ